MSDTTEGFESTFDGSLLSNDGLQGSGTLCEMALDLADKGYYVFPVHGVLNGECDCMGRRGRCNPGKHPCVPWTRVSTKDLTHVRELWSKYPNANIGIDCGRSGVAVLDEDPKNGGELSFQRILRTVPDVGSAPNVVTGSGGTHAYFAAPTYALKNSAGKFPGIDVRAKGGYVVAQGSLHVSGRSYVGNVPAVSALPAWPSALTELLMSKTASTTSHKLLQRSSPSLQSGMVPVGARNQYAASMAGRLRFAGLLEEDAFVALRALRDSKFEEPSSISDDEIRAAIRSIYSNPDGHLSAYSYLQHWLERGVTGPELLFLSSILVDVGRNIRTPSLPRIEQVSGLSKNRILNAREGVVGKGLLDYIPGFNKIKAARYSFPALPIAGAEIALPDSVPIIKPIREGGGELISVA
jgi:hypothetical protein